MENRVLVLRRQGASDPPCFWLRRVRIRERQFEQLADCWEAAKLESKNSTGTILFDNRTTGGALVRMRVPARQGVTPASPMGAVESARPEIAATGHHVLLVDDEPQVLSLLARGLEKFGHRVTCAADGTEALLKLSDTSVDVIVSDLMMPRMSGMELAESVATQYPALRRRFIVITGGAMTPAAEAFVRRNDVVVFPKPISLADLSSAVYSAVLR